MVEDRSLKKQEVKKIIFWSFLNKSEAHNDQF